MGLPKEYAERLKTLVKREPVTLPDLELGVVVRGLTGGEVQRVTEHKRSDDMQIALSTENERGEPIWNPASQQDLDEIGELQAIDRAVILEASNRLSGLGKLKALLASLAGENGSSSSRSDSAARSGSLAKRSAAKS